VLEEIIMEGDVAPLRFPVTMEKETVMALEMEEQMMEMQDVNQDWSVDPTIVRSLASTTMRRMTVVTYLVLLSQHQDLLLLVSYLVFP